MNDEEKSQSEWLRQYDALASKFNEIYLASKERGHEAMAVALEKAKQQLISVHEFSAERGEKLKQYLARDLDQTISYARKVGDEAKKRLHPSRLETGALASLAGVLELAGNAMLSLGHKARQVLSCKTGEITSAGTLTCQSCGQAIHFGKTGHVPPCPRCKGTRFSKSF